MPGCLQDLVHLGGGNVPGIDATDAFSLQVDLEHDLGGSFPVLGEELLDDLHNELHGCEVVVEQDDLEHLRRLDALRPAFEHHRITIARAGWCDGCGGVFRFTGGHEIDSSGHRAGSSERPDSLAAEGYIDG